MDQKEYEMLKTRIQKRFRASLIKAKAVRDKELAAVEQVWVLLQEVSEDRSSPRESAPEKPSKLIDLVRASATGFSDKFTAKEITEYIQAVCGGETLNIRVSSVSSALVRLCDAKEISIHERGSGRKPTTYLPRLQEEENDEK